MKTGTFLLWLTLNSAAAIVAFSATRVIFQYVNNGIPY